MVPKKKKKNRSEWLISDTHKQSLNSVCFKHETHKKTSQIRYSLNASCVGHAWNFWGPHYLLFFYPKYFKCDGWTGWHVILKCTRGPTTSSWSIFNYLAQCSPICSKLLSLFKVGKKHDIGHYMLLHKYMETKIYTFSFLFVSIWWWCLLWLINISSSFFIKWLINISTIRLFDNDIPSKKSCY